MHGLSIGDKSGDLAWTLAYFSGSIIFSTADISHTFCQSATKYDRVIPRIS